MSHQWTPAAVTWLRPTFDRQTVAWLRHLTICYGPCGASLTKSISWEIDQQFLHLSLHTHNRQQQTCMLHLLHLQLFFWGDNLWRSIKPDRKTACLRLSGVSCLCTPVNRRDLNAQLQRLADVIPVEGWSQCLRLDGSTGWWYYGAVTRITAFAVL